MITKISTSFQRNFTERVDFVDNPFKMKIQHGYIMVKGQERS